MKKQITLSENELKNLIYRIIKEVRGGYDDFNIMQKHFETTLEYLLIILSDLSKSILILMSAVESTDNAFGSESFFTHAAERLIIDIQNYKDVCNSIFVDLPEDNIIRYGKILMKSLDTFEENLRRILSFGRDFFVSNEDFKDKLRSYVMKIMKDLKNFDSEIEKTVIEKNELFNRKDWGN